MWRLATAIGAVLVTVSLAVTPYLQVDDSCIGDTFGRTPDDELSLVQLQVHQHLTRGAGLARQPLPFSPPVDQPKSQPFDGAQPAPSVVVNTLTHVPPVAVDKSQIFKGASQVPTVVVNTPNPAPSMASDASQLLNGNQQAPPVAVRKPQPVNGEQQAPTVAVNSNHAPSVWDTPQSTHVLPWAPQIPWTKTDSLGNSRSETLVPTADKDASLQSTPKSAPEQLTNDLAAKQPASQAPASVATQHPAPPLKFANSKPMKPRSTKAAYSTDPHFAKKPHSIKAETNSTKGDTLLEQGNGHPHLFHAPKLPAELDNDQTQVKVFMSMLAILSVALAVLIFLLHQPKQPSPYVLAAIACIAFGVDNFASSYAVRYLSTPSGHVGMVFLLDFVFAVFVHNFMKLHFPDYKSEWAETLKTSAKPLAFTFLTAFFIVCSMLCANIGFNIDEADAGPHQALVCGDILIVGPFFYFRYGERLTGRQLAGCLLIVVGMLFMSNTFTAPKSHETQAFYWLFLTMAFDAASIISWRLISTGAQEVLWRPRLILIFGFIGLMGCFAAPIYIERGDFAGYINKPVLLAWPFLDTSAFLLGMWSVNLAYQNVAASMGAVTAVEDLNSVGLLLMNAVVLGMVPSAHTLGGMFVVLLGGFFVLSAEVAECAEPSV